jgi:hypothetical protein
MKIIYLAHSVTNGGQNLQKIRALISCLEKRKSTIIQPTPNLFPDTLADVSLKAIEKSDCVIADITTYSHGVGFELGYAYALGKDIVVICDVCAKGRVSKFILGLFPNIIFYDNQADLEAKIISRL